MAKIDTSDVLIKWGNELLDGIRSSIDKNRLFNSGELRQSVGLEFKQGTDKIILNINMADYYQFMDEGVQGTGATKPNLNSTSPFSFTKQNIASGVLDGWVNNSGVLGSFIGDTGLDKDKAIKSLTFLIGRSIASQGLKRTNFYSDVVNKKSFDDLSKMLSKALKKNIEVVIEDIKKQK